MNLSEDLLSDLVKVTNNDDIKSNNDDLLYGTVVEYGGSTYVKLDGSGLLTPVNKTTVIKDQDRVTITIKNHIATILGNLTSPSASSTDLSELGDTVTEFGTIVSHKVDTDDIQAITAKIDLIKAQLIQSTVLTTEELTAINAQIDNIKSKCIDVDHLTADDIDVINGEFDNLSADLINTYGIETNIINAVNGYINYLKTYTADFTYVSAVKAQVKDLQTIKLSADDAEIKYANIDFANVNLANIGKLFTKSGIIENLVVGDQTITGKLVGVTIIGDLIEAGTLKADRIIVEGEDGLYYKLNINGETVEAEQTEYNSLNGNIITAQSITASKVNVSDLSAFNATIGGYHIDSDRLYSGSKQHVDNDTRGAYLDNDGQINFGDSNNYLKFHKEYILTDTQPDDWATNWKNYFRFFDFYNLTNLNIVLNGDFSNGTTGYTVSTLAACSINDHIATCLANAAGDTIKQTITTIVGHKYYFMAKVKATTNLISIYMSNAQASYSGSGDFENVSLIFTATSTSHSVGVIETRTSNYDNFYVEEFFVIDLTDKFGSGNEPIQSQIDTWLESEMIGYLQLTNSTVPTWVADTFYYNTGNYVLDISAKSIKFGSNKNLENYTDTNNQNMDTIFKKLAYVEVSSDNNNPYIELGKIGSPFRLKLTNTEMDFSEGTNVISYISDQTLMIEKSLIKDNETIGETYYVLTLSQPTDWSTNWTNYYTLANDIYSKVTDETVPTWTSNTFYYKNAGFMWKQRENGNMGLSWLGDD